MTYKLNSTGDTTTATPIEQVEFELDSTIPEYSADITSSTKLPTSIVFCEVIKNINPHNIIKAQYRSNTVSARQPDNILKLRN